MTVAPAAGDLLRRLMAADGAKFLRGPDLGAPEREGDGLILTSGLTTEGRAQRRSHFAMKQSRPLRRSHNAAASALERPVTRRA